MGLFSFLSKNKQQNAKSEGEFYSRAEDSGPPARSRKRKQAPAAKSAKSGKDEIADDGPLDPVLPEKKRARRRLVGAVALVLAMIIGLPMILDSEPKQRNDDIAIQIPSRDKMSAPDSATTVPPVSAPVTPVAPPAAASTTSSVPAAASLGPHEQIVTMPDAATKPTLAVDAKAAKQDAKQDVKQPAVADKAASKAVDKPADKTSDKAAEKQADKSVAKAEHTEHKADAKEEARAEAILDGKDVDAAKPAADKKAGKFIVQVAALTSKEKISELQGKLSDAGFKPLLQTVPTDAGVTTRVRVGPFASKEEAESARVKLSKLGLGGKLLPL